ncbi:hypothetical protein BpHYR1_007719 [Brachionus plicatilis]|uniref:Uncharacterized protein n=1 Tax=Brachionus plicatilis TaxID=10195 RepID=A0A3M7PRT6_BRAPC|nr:hypothetical protein BpHYR1_007719 [Brachionus plicatilis]
MNNSSDKPTKINEFFESKDNLEVISWLQDRNSNQEKTQLIVMDGDVLSVQLGVQFELLIFFWSIQTRQIDQAEFLGISRNTIITFQQRLRIVGICLVSTNIF